MGVTRRGFISACAVLGGMPKLVLGKDKWPARPVRLVVGYSAGGGTDVVARLYASRLSELLGQQVIVDNKPGGTGTIAASAVAKAPEDGYTLLMGTPSEMITYALLGHKPPYEQADFHPVARAGLTPVLIAAHPSVFRGTPQEFLRQAKASGKTYSYGTPGTGTPMHFAGEALRLATGADFLHIPYKGAAPATTDTLGNQVNFVIAGLPALIPHVQSGHLKPLAITNDIRSEVLPNVPTVNELLDVDDFIFSNWMTLFGPRALPASIAGTVADQVMKVEADADTRKNLIAAGVDPRPLRGEALNTFLAQELARYTVVAQKANIKV